MLMALAPPPRVETAAVAPAAPVSMTPTEMEPEMVAED
jgi:hypothetical protein